jgi:hypothetical protein
MNRKLDEDGYIFPDCASNFTYNPCALSTSKHKVPKPVESKSTEVVELIYTDVCGPFPNESYGGSKYFLTVMMISPISHWYSLLSENRIPSLRFAHFLTMLKDNSIKRLNEFAVIPVANISAMN